MRRMQRHGIGNQGHAGRLCDYVKSERLFFHSEYSWDIGFSRWCVCLHDVPFISIRRPSNPVARLAQTICDAASRMRKMFSG